MTVQQSSLDTHLEDALKAAEDETACYHLREALQLRVAESAIEDDTPR